MLPKAYKIRAESNLGIAITPTLSILHWKRDSQGALVYEGTPQTPTLGSVLNDGIPVDSTPVTNTGNLYEGAHGRVTVPSNASATGTIYFYLQISEDGVNFADVSNHPLCNVTDTSVDPKSAGFVIGASEF